MKQKSKSNRKNNPNPKSKGFLRMGVRDRAWAARWNVLPTIRICALREGIDIFDVVIDRMTGFCVSGSSEKKCPPAEQQKAESSLRSRMTEVDCVVELKASG